MEKMISYSEKSAMIGTNEKAVEMYNYLQTPTANHPTAKPIMYAKQATDFVYGVFFTTAPVRNWALREFLDGKRFEQARNLLELAGLGDYTIEVHANECTLTSTVEKLPQEIIQVFGD